MLQSHAAVATGQPSRCLQPGRQRRRHRLLPPCLPLFRQSVARGSVAAAAAAAEANESSSASSSTATTLVGDGGAVGGGHSPGLAGPEQRAAEDEQQGMPPAAAQQSQQRQQRHRQQQQQARLPDPRQLLQQAAAVQRELGEMIELGKSTNAILAARRTAPPDQQQQGEAPQQHRQRGGDADDGSAWLERSQTSRVVGDSSSSGGGGGGGFAKGYVGNLSGGHSPRRSAQQWYSGSGRGTPGGKHPAAAPQPGSRSGSGGAADGLGGADAAAAQRAQWGARRGAADTELHSSDTGLAWERILPGRRPPTAAPATGAPAASPPPPFAAAGLAAPGARRSATGVPLSSQSVDQDDMDAAIAHTFPVDQGSPAAPIEQLASLGQSGRRPAAQWPPKPSKAINNVLVVSAALMNSNNQVLLAQRARGNPRFRGLYEFPGGKVEGGEIPQYALQRELYEELGVEVEERSLQALTFVSHRYHYWSHNFLALLFVAEEWRNEPAGMEGQRLVWVDCEQLVSYADKVPEPTKRMLAAVYGVMLHRKRKQEADEGAAMAAAAAAEAEAEGAQRRRRLSQKQRERVAAWAARRLEEREARRQAKQQKLTAAPEGAAAAPQKQRVGRSKPRAAAVAKQAAAPACAEAGAEPAAAGAKRKQPRDWRRYRQQRAAHKQ